MDPERRPADEPSVVQFPLEVWLILAAITTIGVVGMLHAVAALTGEVKNAHDLRIKVATLREDYQRQLRASAEAAEAQEAQPAPAPAPGPIPERRAA